MSTVEKEWKKLYAGSGKESVGNEEMLTKDESRANAMSKN